ncbi:hypothetical protein LJC45_05190 [Alistipes sp. OttesenSCG-928-B03]|nr:hypothetical protein [Alistipes sp. OttesenSCG-928-B03]
MVRFKKEDITHKQKTPWITKEFLGWKLLFLNYRNETPNIFCAVDDFCKEFSAKIVASNKSSSQAMSCTAIAPAI